MQYPQHAETIVTVLLEMLPFVLKYIGRIFLFAILAQVPYILFNQAQDKMYGMELTPFYEVSLNIILLTDSSRYFTEDKQNAPSAYTALSIPKKESRYGVEIWIPVVKK